MVLVCKKCSGNDRLDLRHWLEDRLEHDGHEDDIHVLKVGCLDICPKGRVTALVQPCAGQRGGGCFVVDPSSEREDFYRQVLEMLQRAGETSGGLRRTQVAPHPPSASDAEWNDSTSGN